MSTNPSEGASEDGPVEETIQDEAPERVVPLTVEHITELLQEGETDATVFQPDGEDDLERQDVEVVSMQGPHPMFDTTSDSDTGSADTSRRWLPRKADLVSFGMMLAILGGMYALLPTSTLSINGETVPFPPEAPGFWLVMVVVLTVLWYATAVLQYRFAGRRRWST